MSQPSKPLSPKCELRTLMRAKRRQVPAASRAAFSRALCARLLSRLEARHPALERLTVAIYCAMADEIDLVPLADALAARGTRLVAPRGCAATGDYELAVFTRGNLVRGRWDIPEPPCDAAVVLPEEVDVWLVPGLAFTREGKRLGYGGGYYDRLLAAAARVRKIEAIGVAFPFQILPDLPTEAHDILLSEVVF